MSRRIAWILAVVFLCLTLVGGTVSAHAQYVASTPAASAILSAPPTEVAITLSEPAQAGTGRIQVVNATDARFDVPPVTLSADGLTISVALGPSGPGIYTVLWSVVSAVDGHPTSGSFAFAVQNPDGSLPGPLPPIGPISSGSPVSPAEVGLRALGFLGLAGALGVAVLAAWAWLPAGRDPDVRALRAYGLGLPILLNLGRIAAFVFAASLLGLWALATGLEGGIAAAGLLTSRYIQSLAARIALAIGLFVLLSRAFSTSRASSSDVPAWELRAAALLGLGAIAAGSFGTHAAADPAYAGIGIAADAAHLAGVGLWVGGLAAIVAVRELLRGDEAAPLARIILGRFSRLAGYAVVLVLGGGLVLALRLVGSVEVLLGTAYGWVVLGKVALFTPMIALGAYNRYRLLPKVAGLERPADAVRRLASNVRVETSLGIAVLVLAGLLTSMSPATTVAAGPASFAQQAIVDGLRLDFEIFPYPTVPGIYLFSVYLWDASTGNAYFGARNGTLTFRLQDSSLAPQVVRLDGPHGNHMLNETPALSRPGTWRIDVGFQRIDAFDARATFYVVLRGGA